MRTSNFSRGVLCFWALIALAACGGLQSGVRPSWPIQQSVAQPRSNSQPCTHGPEPDKNLVEYAYVTNGTSNSVSAYTICATTGALTPVAGSPFAAGAGPNTVAVDPTGKFAYVSNCCSENISAYKIRSSGALTPVAGSPFAAGYGPQGVAADPAGKFVYVANVVSNDVSAYKININGALTSVIGSPFAAGISPVSVAVDARGKFVYVPNYDNDLGGNISAYTINGTSGVLTPVTGSPFESAVAPYGSAADPNGKFVYVTSVNTDTLYGYAIDPLSGAITLAAAAGAGFSPNVVAIDPTGKFAYVTDQYDTYDNVHAYTINSKNGALTQVAGSPFSAARNPWGVAVDPTGKFVYVANQNSNDVSAFVIDRATGALTQVEGSPFATGAGPAGVATCRVRKGACKPSPL